MDYQLILHTPEKTRFYFQSFKYDFFVYFQRIKSDFFVNIFSKVRMVLLSGYLWL